MTELLDDLKQIIVAGSAGQDRSQQKAIGPSEVGDPCLRKLAFKLMGVPKVSGYKDPLPSVVGTGAHAMVEEFARRANAAAGTVRWLPETRVTIREGLAGTCDLVDLHSMTVVDWKFPGHSRIAHYRSHGPSDVYRRQAHLYGRGMRNMGIPIETVAICFLPRGGELKHAYLWSEPYDDAVVDETLTRLDTVTAMLFDLDVERHPENYKQIPATPGDCFLCPYWKRPAIGATCDGGKPLDPPPLMPEDHAIARLSASS